MNDSGKQGGIVATLRRRIRGGRYGAGERLPTVRALADEFSLSIPTVSRALGVLVEQGFIATDGRRGTRVVDHPPHRHRFALVLPGTPDGRGRYASLHWQALADAAHELGEDPATAIDVFHAVNEHPELPEHQRLLAAVRDGTVAGLVMCQPRRCDAWLDLGRARLPTIGGPPHPDHPERGTIWSHGADFRAAALTRCAASGRRRLAALLDATAHGFAEAVRLRAAVGEYGIECPAHRVLAAPLAAPDWARPAVAALLRGDPRPDALLVADDNLLADALAALDAAGVGDDEILVVAQANFPVASTTSPSRRPVLRLGWDQREYLLEAMDAIAAWLDHRTPPGERTLPVRGDDEPFRRPMHR